MQSSSSAMSISPMGIINACNPRQASLETLYVASFIYNGSTGFCRDAACAMAAATAFEPTATVDSVIDAATRYLLPTSAQLMRELIRDVVELAQEVGEYESFRNEFYTRFLKPTPSDSHETVPATLALFFLAQGDAERGRIWSANFGRDSDTIATMVGGLCGTLTGTSGIPSAWVAKVEANPDVQYREITERLAEIVRRWVSEVRTHAAVMDSLG